MIIAFVVLNEKMWTIILLLQKKKKEVLIKCSIYPFVKIQYINLGLFNIVSSFNGSLAFVCSREAKARFENNNLF